MRRRSSLQRRTLGWAYGGSEAGDGATPAYSYAEIVGYELFVCSQRRQSPGRTYEGGEAGDGDTPAYGNAEVARLELFVCTNASCTKSFGEAKHRDHHFQYCLPETLPQPALKKGKAAEDFVPQLCEENEICGITVMFGTLSALESHCDRHHSDWPHNRCGVIETCEHNMQEFGSPPSYAQHLRITHDFPPDTVRRHLNLIAEANSKAPPRTSAKFLETQCLHPGCKPATSSLDYEGYITHLRRVHKLSSGEYPEHMPTTTTANPAVVPEPVQPTAIAPAPRRLFAHGSQRCVLQDCAPTTIFRTRDGYVARLREPHGVSRADYGLYMSGDIIATFNVTQCRYPGCMSRLVYQTNDQYNGRLSQVHRVPQQERRLYGAEVTEYTEVSSWTGEGGADDRAWMCSRDTTMPY
ncbi:hypothetical protein LTR02_000099 [Friedmanniomyces endolithicus]|nr:hypothetical protein LTR94_001160 [Friedmanniomyces endolithicus]KAK0816492.1 hypothetical protein LTR59_000120 [Friedmanniomyces endolithicus]KAK0816636.1 hypothetical protein LTR38_002025 [Friedmanniomyces endolithicus]KAK0820888.1 hypothetical protein LTR75_001207 [Friedmanniomyces endolithicus]KAK0853339.1 hypothetical protein LTR03_002900 [Friedmanniomyces endolithicus]